MGKIFNADLDTTLGGASSSDEKLASQKAVKTYVDNQVGTKQATLVSGTNIKTINSQSILGSGDLSVSPTMSYNSSTETLTIS